MEQHSHGWQDKPTDTTNERQEELQKSGKATAKDGNKHILDTWVQSMTKGAEAGKFVLTASKFYADGKLNQGAQTSQDASFYGMSAEFKPMGIQLTVKNEQNIDCGGGYVKLFDCKRDQAAMHRESP